MSKKPSLAGLSLLSSSSSSPSPSGAPSSPAHYQSPPLQQLQLQSVPSTHLHHHRDGSGSAPSSPLKSSPAMPSSVVPTVAQVAFVASTASTSNGASASASASTNSNNVPAPVIFMTPAASGGVSPSASFVSLATSFSVSSPPNRLSRAAGSMNSSTSPPQPKLSSAAAAAATAAAAAASPAAAVQASVEVEPVLDEISFVSPPAVPLICKIHNGIMHDPVIAKCGYSFCRRCLQQKIQATGKCPITGMPLTEGDMWPNLALSEQIGELMVFCRYQKPAISGVIVEDSEGCKMQIKLKDRSQHESTCGFAPVLCPNAKECGPLLATQMEAHLRVCANVPCAHRMRGCVFRGKNEQVTQHLETCKFEALKDLLNERDKRVELLESMLTERNEEIDEMKDQLQQINERMNNLEKMVLGTFQDKVDLISRGMRAPYDVVPNDLPNDVPLLNPRAGAGEDLDVYNHKFKCVGTFVGHTGPVWALALSGDFIYSGSSDLSIKVWDINRRTCDITMNGHEGIIYAVAIIGKTLYSGSSDCTIKAWSLTNFELIKSVAASDNTVCTLATRTNTEHPLLLSGSLKTVTVWDAETMSVIAQLKGHNHWVRALVVSGDRLYSGSYNMIMIWELDSFTCLRTVTCQGGSVYSLAVDTVGHHLISGVYENRIDLYDLHTFQQKGSLNGHTATVYALASTSSGSNRLISASYDNTIKIWNLDTFQCIQSLIRHTSSVAAIAYSKGKIFSAGADNQIKVWS